MRWNLEFILIGVLCHSRQFSFLSLFQSIIAYTFTHILTYTRTHVILSQTHINTDTHTNFYHTHTRATHTPTHIHKFLTLTQTHNTHTLNTPHSTLTMPHPTTLQLSYAAHVHLEDDFGKKSVLDGAFEIFYNNPPHHLDGP